MAVSIKQLLKISGKCQLLSKPKIKWVANSKNYSSYFHCTASEPLLGITLSQALDRTVERFPENEAVVDCHQKIRKKYLQYRTDIDNFATGLLALDLRKGDRIGIWAPNCYEWLVTQHAASRIGLILVSLSSLNQVREQEYCFAKSGLRAVVSAESFRQTQYYPILQELLPELGNGSEKLQSKRFPNLERIIMISDKKFQGTLSYDSILNAGGSEARAQLEIAKKQVQIHDPACIYFTSGTTGRPKGACHSHHNVVNMAHFFGRGAKYDDSQAGQKLCNCNPLFHAMGGVLSSTGSLMHGNCIVLPAPVYSTQMTLEAIHKEKCSIMSGTPTMYFDILHHPDFDKNDMSSLKTGIIGGASMPTELHRLWCKKIKTDNLLIGYGLTECTSIVVLNFPGNDLTLKENTVGSPFYHVEVKIVDEKGDLVPWGTPGEILVRGHNTMIGYWEDEENTRKSYTADRWFRTGDILTMESTGVLKMVGRKSDMIIRGGSNIYPKEVEDFLLTHPKIAEIYVFGIPDERLGETVCAWVLLKNNEVMTEEDVKDFCKNQIASYKAPAYVKFVKDFPKLGTGKVDKKIMREQTVRPI